MPNITPATKPSCPHCGCSLAVGPTGSLCPLCLMDALATEAPGGDGAPAVQGATAAAGSLVPIAGYTVVAEIARGGMGIVYRARQREPDREVALKMLLPFSAASPELRERLHLEARALAELDHPAILPIYGKGDYDGLPWFSMKLATGGTLAAAAPRFHGQWRAIAELVATLADAVQFAHERGVLHRDLKPGNILFDGAGRPFVADFGLAKLLRDDGDFTRTAMALGTPSYLAPEIAARSAREATTASDVYSLGAILFELLAGRPPFQAEGVPALMRKIAEEELATVGPAKGQPSSRATRVPRDLEVITLKCLAKNPAQRYGSARELAGELRRWLAGEPILARPAGAAEKMWRWSRRKPALAAALAACAVIATAGVVGIALQLRRTEAARATAVQKGVDEQIQRTRAETALRDAERSGLALRQNLYAADMLGVQRALAQNDLGTARILLEAHRPAAGQADLRGFEWRYFWGQAKPRSFLTLPELDNEVTALVFSPDGAHLAFGSREVLVYDTATFQLRARAPVPSVQSIAFFPGGGSLLVATRYMAMRPWDWRVEPRPPRFTTPPACYLVAWNWRDESSPPVWFDSGGRWPNVALSRTGMLAAGIDIDHERQAGGATALYRSMPVDAAAPRRALPESGGLAAFSPDGHWLATAAWPGSIKLWDSENGELVKTLPGPPRATSLRFSPDGQALVVCGFDASAWLYEIAGGTGRPVGRGHAGRVVDAEISPDGRTLATSGTDQTVRLWDLQSGRQTALLLGHSYIVSRVAWSPTGRLLASGGQDGTVRLWKTDQAQAEERPLAGRSAQHLFSRDGRFVVTVGAEGKLTLHEFPGLKPIAGPLAAGLPLGFGADGATLLTLRRPPGASAEIVRWSVPGLAPTRTEALPASDLALRAPVLSADGRWLAAGQRSGEIGLWDLTGAVAVRRLAFSHIGFLQAAAFSPDSRQLAASFQESTAVHLWELSSAPVRRELPGHKGFVRNLVFSSDGRTLASADGDKFIKLWDPSDRREIATLLGHREGVSAVAFAPDGLTLATGSGDRTLRLWNLATHREVSRFEMESAVPSIAFSPDGGALLITTLNAGGPQTKVWRAPSLAEADAEPTGAK